MIEMKAQIALDLVPLMKRLYRSGIIHIGPEDAVHMTVEAFREVFPEVLEPMPRESVEYPWEWSMVVDGVKFFALDKAKDGA